MKSKIDLTNGSIETTLRLYKYHCHRITVFKQLYTKGKEKFPRDENFALSPHPLPPPFISPIHPTPSNNFFPHIIDYYYYSHKDEIREIRVIIFYREIAINHRAFNTHRLNWRDTEVFSTAKFHRDRVARRVDTR